jgi:hypothetical protein
VKAERDVVKADIMPVLSEQRIPYAKSQTKAQADSAILAVGELVWKQRKAFEEAKAKKFAELDRRQRLAQENLLMLQDQLSAAEKRDLIRRIEQSKRVRGPQQSVSPTVSMYVTKGVQEQQ